MNLQALGVTRVARVTGLDRTGVEVACAVRPLGHVLQVTNGKGATFEAAKLSALGEAAELHAAEHPDPSLFRFASTVEMRRRFGHERVWPADDLGSAGALTVPQLWTERTRIAWTEGRELFSGAPVWVPAQAVFCPPQDAAPLGPLVVAWTTNGLASHETVKAAARHAFLEALERNELSLAIPVGFGEEEVQTRKLSARAVERASPSLRELLARLEAESFSVTFLDLCANEGGSGFPVAGAVLCDLEGGAVPLTAGYACRPTWAEALEAALYEAAQSRLTDIHGAREDVQHEDSSQAEAFTALASEVEGRSPTPPKEKTIEGALRRAGASRAAVIELPCEGLDVAVVKVVVPGFSVSELL